LLQRPSANALQANHVRFPLYLLLRELQ